MTEVALKTMWMARQRLLYYARNDHGLSLEQTQNTINLFDAIIDNAIDRLADECHVPSHLIRDRIQNPERRNPN